MHATLVLVLSLLSGTFEMVRIHTGWALFDTFVVSISLIAASGLIEAKNISVRSKSSSLLHTERLK